MSWYLANTAGTGDQFASGQGLVNLRKAATPYASLMQFLDDGMTKNVELCENQLRQLAERTDDEDVKNTATGLADLMKGQDLVAITQGFSAAQESEATPATESLRESETSKHQTARDKAIRSATRKIATLARSRFRAQRKAVLDSHALANLHRTLEFSGHVQEADKPDRDRLEADIATSLGTQIYTVPVTAEETETFSVAIAAAIEDGRGAAVDMLDATGPQTTESFIAEYLKDGGFSQLTGDLDKTTVDDLASAVADAYESGADFDGVVQAVKDSFAQASQFRAKMIAQSELNNAWNQSVFHFGKEAGATKKSWITDLAPCIVCIGNALDGEIDIDADFSSGDDAPTAHPNCFCSLLVHA